MKHSLKPGREKSSINMGLFIIAAMLLNSFMTLAQTPQTAGAPSDMQLDAAVRSAVIEGALKNLNEAYVFPEVAKKMEHAIRSRIERKEYEQITSPQLLASTLTTHLREVSHDKHLRVVYNRDVLPIRKEPSNEDREKARASAKSRNFGFQKVEQLDGNLGYIDLRGFQNAEWAGDTAAEAMNAVANTDALIFDMRNNGGGQPEMVQLLCSYLFDKRTHINDIYWRPTNKTTEYWTLDKVAGKKYGEQKEVYVLTSRRTFSAAEEFTYNLKNLKRATIVGETTGGGAHPVDFYRINDHFGIGVPAGRAINPITKTNWEGTGVKPDVEVPADQALKVAQLRALKNIVAKNTDSQRREKLTGLIAALQKELDEKSASGAKPAMQMSSEINTSQPKAIAPTSDEVNLPNTPAGKTLAAFLQAFNTGSLETLKKFHNERGGNAENANQDIGFFNESGGLKIHSIKSSSEYAIEVLAQAKKDGHWLSFSIEVESSAPHAIAGIRIQPASAPTGNTEKSATHTGDEVKLPDTPAGKTLAAFLKSLNSGDLQTMKRFHTERGDTDENAQQDFEFYNRSGGLKIHSLVRSSDYEITTLVQKKKDGGWLNLTIQTQSSPPHAIDQIDVQPAAPASNEKSAASPTPASVNTTASNMAPAKKLTEAETLKELEAFLDKQAAEDKLSGAVLLAKDGKPILKKTYGLADKSAKAPNKIDTKFNLGSMNKMFTAVAIAQLAEKGKLTFDDKVGKFLPDYPNKDVREKVTIHQLLTHTSGLGSYWNKKFDESKASIKTVADYLALFADEPLLFEPGARFEYSNSGFIVLGAIIEKVSGQSYYDYVREHIYQRAGMTNSDAYEMHARTPNLAMGYAGSGGEAGRKENTGSRPNRGGPAGGGYSTVEDLLKFAVALRENKLLSAQYTELVTTGKVKMGSNKYAYGFGDLNVNGKRSFGHNGGAPGIASSLSIFPELGYTVIVMTNYDPPNMMPVVRKLEQMITNLN
jgi:CubicO group peptidase (beta-lactamase class C family)/C-terminal processing protease CtpA/Prc